MTRPSPIPEAARATPYRICELDTHDDATRIWATIMEDREYDDDMHDAEIEAKDEEIEDLEEKLADAKRELAHILETFTDLTLALAHDDEGLPDKIEHYVPFYRDEDTFDAKVMVALEKALTGLVEDIRFHHFED